jgi:hypothetical protein
VQRRIGRVDGDAFDDRRDRAADHQDGEHDVEVGSI